MDSNPFSSDYNVYLQDYPKHFMPPKPPRAPPSEYIIPLPEKAKVVKRKRRILLLDSKDRNLTLYPNANKFEYPLMEPYNDILQFQLLSACMPRSDYIIHEHNNMIYVKEKILDQTNVFATGVKIGDYTTCTLPKAIEDALNLESNGYVVSYDETTDTISIGNTKRPFTLLFKAGETTYGPQTTTNFGYVKHAGKVEYKTETLAEFPNQPVYLKNSIGSVIGFGILDVSSPDYKESLIINNEYDTIVIDADDAESGEIEVDSETFEKVKAYVIRGTNRVNLCGCDYVLIHIPRFRRYDSFNPTVQGSFTRVPLTNEVIDFTNIDYGSIKYFNPPFQRLDRIRISVFRPDGTLYNFRGKNYVLTFGIVCLNQPGRFSLEFDN